MRQNEHFYQTNQNIQFYPIRQGYPTQPMKENIQFTTNLKNNPRSQIRLESQHVQTEKMRRNDQPQPFYRQWLNQSQGLRSSQSSELNQKVPKQMRSSLKKQKSIQQAIAFDNFYQGIINVLDSKTFNCSICLDTLRNPLSISSCNHKFCSECVVGYLTYKINSMEEIFCPHESCDLKVDFNSNGWNSLPQEYKEKYKKQQLWRQTIKNPDIKLCPNQKCQQGTINLRKIPLTCQKCRTMFCQECMMVAHAGKQCDQNFRQNFKQWKRCTKCQIFIQKIDGCNHMVCRCKNEFCFVCLADWTNDHYACVEERENDLIITNDTCCPKLIAIFMASILPIFIIIGIASIPIFIAGAIIFALLFCLYIVIIEFSRSQWLFCLIFVGIIFLPIVIIGFSLWGLFGYYIPVLLHYLRSYLRNIQGLWNTP